MILATPSVAFSHLFKLDVDPAVTEECSICLATVNYLKSSEGPPSLPGALDHTFCVGHECETTEIKTRHVFHRNCIAGWLKDHANCPMCRIRVHNAEWVVAGATHQKLTFQAMQERQKLLVQAIEQGQMQEVQGHLESGLIFLDGRSTAIEHAAKHGLHECVTALLGHGPILKESRERAILHAVDRGHLPVLQTLLRVGRISPDLRKHSVILAATRGVLPILEEFLRQPLNIGIRSVSVEKAVSGGYLSIVQRLLHNGSIFQVSRGHALLQAVRGGHVALISLLCAGGRPMPSGVFGHALSEAAIGRDIAVLQRVIHHGSFSSTERVRALRGVLLYDMPLIVERVRMLLDSGDLTIRDRGELLQGAVWLGHAEVVRLLLVHGPILPLHRQYAQEHAAVMRREDLSTLIAANRVELRNRHGLENEGRG